MGMRRTLTRAYPQLIGLSYSSLEIAQYFEQLRPAWMPNAKREIWGDKSFFRILISNATGSLAIVIDDYHNLLDIGFAHSFWKQQIDYTQGKESAVKKAIVIADSIMEEAILFVVTLQPILRRARSGHIRVVYTGCTPEELKAIPEAELHHVRSWNGTYDRDYHESKLVDGE